MKSVIDFHTHILPGIDDGSSSVAKSLAMLRREAEQGIQHVVLTPHFYANHASPSKFLAKRQEAEAKLREAMTGVQGLPKLSVGAEVYFFEGISDAERLPDLAISGTNCVLVEMPMKQWSDRNLHELEGIYQKQGLVPIVAHIDRYISPFRTHRIPERLAALSTPILVQANADFFTNRFTQKFALKMLAAGKINLLGSDCHNLDSRPPNLDGALRVIERSLGSRMIDKIHSLEMELMGE